MGAICGHSVIYYPQLFRPKLCGQRKVSFNPGQTGAEDPDQNWVQDIEASAEAWVAS